MMTDFVVVTCRVSRERLLYVPRIEISGVAFKHWFIALKG